MNGFDNSTDSASEEESMSDNERMFLYARVVHSNHSFQYHIGYLLPLANLAAQTEFSEWGKVCSG